MSKRKPSADIARTTLLRLGELGLPPTPENFSQYYYEISGEEAPSNTRNNNATCNELMQMVKAVLDAVSEKTGDLATDLKQRNSDIKQSIDHLNDTQEKQEILQLLGNIVSKANLIQGAVSDTHEDLVATRLALDHIKNELQETRQQLNEDALTGAQNRRAMDAVLAQEVARSRRSGNKLSVAMVDIDHFKDVNDKYGHNAGDDLLLHITTVTKSVLREADTLVRYGGEEFLLILPESETRGAEFVLNRLKQVIKKSPLIYEGKKISVTFSGGIAQLKPDENGHALVIRADAALYQAKQAGRNRIVLAAE